MADDALRFRFAPQRRFVKPVNKVRERPIVGLWIAIAVMAAGRLVDLQWHVSHDEFEGTTQQLEAHWLAWIGVILVLIAAGIALRADPGTGFRLAFVSAAAYVPVAIWHFVEHANGADPQVAHVLLGITGIGMVVGAVLASFEVRRARRPV